MNEGRRTYKSKDENGYGSFSDVLAPLFGNNNDRYFLTTTEHGIIFNFKSANSMGTKYASDFKNYIDLHILLVDQ